MSRKEEDSSRLATNRRLKGVVAQIPICYGNIAWWQGPKADPARTHKWTVFLRGCQNEDLSYFIKKVVFTLHNSFEKPKRVNDKAPYEETEMGWGEFEISIKIYFVDASERPVELFHILKLYPLDGSTQVKKRPVIAEQYDEIVFHEPTESFYAKLKQYETAGPGIRIVPHPSVSTTNISLNETAEAQKILSAKKKIQEEHDTLKKQYDKADAEIEQIKATLAAKGRLLELHT